MFGVEEDTYKTKNEAIRKYGCVVSVLFLYQMAGLSAIYRSSPSGSKALPSCSDKSCSTDQSLSSCLAYRYCEVLCAKAYLGPH